MDITIEFADSLSEKAIGCFVERSQLIKQNLLGDHAPRQYIKMGTGGNIRVKIPLRGDRIVISTGYLLAHARTHQMLGLARNAVLIGSVPTLSFSHEFFHLDLEEWFPEISKNSMIRVR
jgi:hypothetical protein